MSISKETIRIAIPIGGKARMVEMSSVIPIWAVVAITVSPGNAVIARSPCSCSDVLRHVINSPLTVGVPIWSR